MNEEASISSLATICSIHSSDILIKIISTALNPVDWKIQGPYSHLLSSYPGITGTDGAGVVERLGSEVSGFSKGDRVWVDPRPFVVHG